MNETSGVEEYLQGLDADRQQTLRQLRAFIQETVPTAEESMSYNMPTFETNDVICAFASQKNYLALYMCDTDLLSQYAEELSHLNCGKSCIRFHRWEELPLQLIRKILIQSADLSEESH